MVGTGAKMIVSQELIRKGSDLLKENGVEESQVIAELLLAHILNCRRHDLHRLRNDSVPAEICRQFDSLIQRASSHEPVQYITGEIEFMGMSILVDRRVLIPRPETEILVEEVIRIVKDRVAPPRILEIGTGSGNIAVALAKFLPEALIETIDTDGNALEIARKNILRHKVESTVFPSKFDIFSDSGMPESTFDIIVSNPPYISYKEYHALPSNVRQFEPMIALTDSGDGLTFYRRIAEVSKSLSTPGGIVVVEIAYNQANDVRQIFLGAGFVAINLTRDFNGIERVLTATSSGS